jgi:hypothetical protein
MSKDFPEYYEFNGVTYSIDWTDYKSINLFISHLDQSIVEKELELVDSYCEDMDVTEAQDMLKSIGVQL